MRARRATDFLRGGGGALFPLPIPHPSNVREARIGTRTSRCVARQNSIVEKDFSARRAGLTPFPQPGILEFALSGSSSVVEHRLAKARVASSSLVSRSIPHFSGAYQPGEEWNETIRNP